MRLYRLIQILLVAGSILAFLVWALPGVIRIGPSWCARWNLTTGICGERVLESLKKLDRWTERTLRPRVRGVQTSRVLETAYGALRTAERAARKGLGDETVNAAIRGVDLALAEMEGLVGGEGKAREKLADVPDNAQKLLTEARLALEQLRNVLSRTERRAEDVTTAVDNTRKALDALSDVLPKQ